MKTKLIFPWLRFKFKSIRMRVIYCFRDYGDAKYTFKQNYKAHVSTAKRCEYKTYILIKKHRIQKHTLLEMKKKNESFVGFSVISIQSG